MDKAQPKEPPIFSLREFDMPKADNPTLDSQPYRRSDTFFRSRFPSVVRAMERLTRNPSPFEPTILKWELRENAAVFVEWLALPTRQLGKVLGYDPTFDLRRRLLFRQDILDHGLLTGDRPSARSEQMFSVSRDFRLHIPLQHINELGISHEDAIDFVNLRFEWEDPLEIGDAYTTAALLADLLRGAPLQYGPERHPLLRKRLAERISKKASQVFEPIPELSNSLNDILASALSPSAAARITSFQELRSLYMETSRAMLAIMD